MTIKNTLPNKPSELINIALNDLIRVERMKRYVVRMGEWHRPEDYSDLSDTFKHHAYNYKPTGICQVCLAGAVMANTLGSNPTKELDPSDFEPTVAGKLNALDEFRSGWVHDGITTMGLSGKGDGYFIPDDLPVHVSFPAYYENRGKWKRGMRKMVRMLEAVGM